MFNLAIDSKLRGCDLVALKFDDIVLNGQAIDRAIVRQKKTGKPVRFELTKQTRQAVDDYLQIAGKSRRFPCLPAVAVLGEVFPRDSMYALFPNGSKAPNWTRVFSELTPCDEPRRQ